MPINPQTVATHWTISPECAKLTVVMTMQRGVMTCLNPTLSWHFLTNDQMLWYKCVLHTMFSDTMFAGSMSQQINKMIQAYMTSFGWACAHPMKCKGEAHETLSLVFQCNGGPLTMVTNDSKERLRESSDKNSRRLTATLEWPNPTLDGSKPLRAENDQDRITQVLVGPLP